MPSCPAAHVERIWQGDGPDVEKGHVEANSVKSSTGADVIHLMQPSCKSTFKATKKLYVEQLRRVQQFCVTTQKYFSDTIIILL